MRQRIAKEFRSVQLPFFVALGSAPVVAFFKHADGMLSSFGAESVGFFAALFSFALFSSMVLIPALLFGAEFQHRTLQLLLSQPLKRSWIWREKMGVAIFSLAGIGLALLLCHEALKLSAGQEFMAWAVANLWPGHEYISGHASELDGVEFWILGTTASLATACSTGFWTLVAGSTIGGIVFAMAFESLPLLILAGIFERLGMSDATQIDLFEAAGIIYALIFCWLSRRSFCMYQLRGESPRIEFGFAKTGFGKSKFARWIPGWLICKPAGEFRNLVRKELMLQRPVFLIAGVMTGVWLLTFMLFCLQPARKELYEAVFVGLTGFYIPLVALLAACLPTGEEKSLRIASWHLTLPVTAKRQWFIRLAVAGLVWIVLGLLLPWMLAGTASPATSADIFGISQNRNNLLQVLFFTGILFSLGVWSINIVNSTVRAVLVALMTVVGLASVLALSIQLSQKMGGLETGLLAMVSSLPVFPSGSARQFDWGIIGFYVSGLSLGLMALRQGMRLFRRSEHTRREIVGSALVLALTALVLGLWFGDLLQSAQQLQAFVREQAHL